MSTQEALEAAHCARINLDNMVKRMPLLADHCLLLLVQEQIETCIKELEKDED